MKENRKNIFSLVVSIVTLFIMTIGATFAFFSSKTGSLDDVSVGSAFFSVELGVTGLYDSEKIMPIDDSDVITAFNNECVDELGKGACVAYNITVSSDSAEQDVIINFKSSNENIPNLKYMVLDNDDGNSVFQSADYTSSNYTSVGDAVHLDIGDTRKFILLIWLSNVDDVQNNEGNQSFTGSVMLNSSSGTKITGSISNNF